MLYFQGDWVCRRPLAPLNPFSAAREGPACKGCPTRLLPGVEPGRRRNSFRSKRLRISVEGLVWLGVA
jgi:hypothetical protein